MHAPDTKPKMRPFVSQTERFASGAESPRDYLEACLATVDTWEPKVGAFVATSFQAARAAADRSAERWKKGAPLSAIDGMAIGVKDIIDVADMPTEMGSPLFAGWQPGKDAACVWALRQAGAVILGKTVTTEFAASEPRGTRNPWNVAHTPGGSSSGSAAGVACGMFSAGLGTQVIGSTIRPASFCGTFGFKPTVGALNRQGCHDYQSQSATGILAATLDDTWQVTYEIASRVGGDAGNAGLTGPGKAPAPVKPRRIAFVETSGWNTTTDGAKACMQDSLQKLAAAGIEIRTRHDDDTVAALETELEEATALSHRVNTWETRWFLDGCAGRDASKLSKAMQDRHAQGQRMTIAQYCAALKERARIRALYAELWRTCDICLTLSAHGGAPAGLNATGNPEYAVPSSLLGVPALSLPLFMIDGMPLGLQVIGFADKDAAAFAHSAWLASHLG